MEAKFAPGKLLAVKPENSIPLFVLLFTQALPGH